MELEWNPTGKRKRGRHYEGGLGRLGKMWQQIRGEAKNRV